MYTTAQILDTLRARGHRITRARAEIVKILEREKSPLQLRQLAQKVAADETSAYRTVALLLAEGFVEVIQTKGAPARYALSLGHHHHVVCVDCGKIAHVPCTKGVVPPAQVEGFTEIRTHEVTFYGTCTVCR